MKKNGVLNRDLSALIGAMGHYDRLVVADAGFSIGREQRCIDLSMRPNQPTTLDVVELILVELEVEKIHYANEVLAKAPDRHEQLSALAPDRSIEPVSHQDFRELAGGARGVVRTGDFLPYGNVMLVSGVIY